MQPLAEFPLAARQAIRIVLSDIDDTLTTAGRLPASSLAALEALNEAGFIVIPVTGRPAGWCDHIARMWPVHAVVGENGALYFSYDHEQRKMRSAYAKTEQQRQQDRARLEQLREHILATVPGAGVASDQAYRIADLAIDFCEDVPPLPAQDVARIVELFQQAGATAKVSSIHVNGWFGDYDKLSMCKNFYQTEFGEDLSQGLNRAAFIGDSPNDEPMFAFFENSVAVGNIQKFLPQLEYKPRYLVPKEGGEGFAAFADHLLDN